MKKLSFLLMAALAAMPAMATSCGTGDEQTDSNSPTNLGQGNPGEQPEGTPGGGPSGSSSASTGAASATGYSQSSGSNTASGQTYTSTNSDENAVQITGGTFTMTDCTVEKASGDTGDSDGSSFYGINSAVYCGGSSSTLTVSGGTITTSATGANAVMAYNGGTINISDVTINTSSNLSRGIHATGGGIINATNLSITTAKTNCSVIATDRGGGTVTVNGGTYNTTGDDSAITYSTGTIAVSDATGTSTVGEIGVIEGDNTITLNNCAMTSGSTKRGMMILQSGSGDSEGYNGAITVNGGSLTTTSSAAPLLEVPTYITGTLTLKDVQLSIASGTLMYVDYNTQWTTSGGTGNLILTTDSTCTYTGNVAADQYSTATVNVGEGVTWNGAIDNANTAKATEVTVNGTWTLTADSYVDNLTVNAGAAINTNGHNLSYGTLSGVGTVANAISSANAETAETPETLYTLGGAKAKTDTLAKGIYVYKGKTFLSNK